jgi:mannitol/fructose-specific phosphotransferase system IIA component (Ntr-type)
MTTEATPKMKLREIIVQEAIVPTLAATQRDDVIAELVDALLAGGAADASMRDELISLVLEREERGSTGFGRGVAVPHVKHKDVETLQAAIGLSRSGVDFNSLDNQPVYSVFLLLSPAEKPEDHLQAMEIIFKNLSQETFRRFLRQAESIDDVLHLLEEADHQKFA